MNKLLLIAVPAIFTLTATAGFSKTNSTNLSAVSADTTLPSPSGGIHIIDGNNSTVGMGDVDTKILLTNTDLKKLLQMVVSKQSSPKDTIVGIMLMQGSNGGSAAIQVENYLNSNGFRVGSHGQSLGEPFNGVSVYSAGVLGIQVIIGNINQ
ncbi:MAG TPA: hypothetical protein VK718_04205 [Ferruginibacter sp.]|jgi:hypothetical protein|nr:hypothetical protein [Ferruginibacter sp.]